MYKIEPFVKNRWFFFEAKSNDVVIFQHRIKWYLFVIFVNLIYVGEVRGVEVYGRIKHCELDRHIKKRSFGRVDRYFSCEDMFCHTLHKIPRIRSSCFIDEIKITEEDGAIDTSEFIKGFITQHFFICFFVDDTELESVCSLKNCFSMETSIS